MKYLAVFLLLLIFPNWPPPTEIPTTLDEAWVFMVEQRQGWYWPPCQAWQVSMPYVSYDMAVEATHNQRPDRTHDDISMDMATISKIVAPGGGIIKASGHVTLSENLIFSKLIQITLEGNFWSCGDKTGHPMLFGPGVQEFLAWLDSNAINQ